jgi:Fe-S cluster assembly ATPase SufC
MGFKDDKNEEFGGGARQRKTMAAAARPKPAQSLADEIGFGFVQAMNSDPKIKTKVEAIRDADGGLTVRPIQKKKK